MNLYLLKKISIFSVFALLICTAISCGDDEDPIDPVVECETADLTYSNFAAALINNNCATSGCHDADATSNGAVGPMDDYNNAVAFIGFGRTLGAVNHDSGFSPMPKGGTKLDSCSIAKLTAWVDAGMPE